MTKLDIADPPLEPVTLGLNARRTLGAETRAPGRLPDRVRIGEPVCVALDPATVDPDSRQFLDSRPGSTFWLLSLVCSFRVDDDEPMTSAWLEVVMTTTSPPGAGEPTAWSMEPLTLEDPVEVSRVVNLDMSLKLTSEVIPVEIGPSAGSQTTRTHTEREPYVEAYGEGTSRPSWIFSRTQSTEIRGTHRLRAVVELPTTAVATAEVGVGAEVRLKLLGLVPYRTGLDDVPQPRRVRIGPA